MSGGGWYWARIRWAVMEERRGLRRWEEKVYVFLSPSREAAFEQALAAGRRGESAHEDSQGWVATRLAAMVELDWLGAGLKEFEVDVEAPRAVERLPFDHEFDPAASEPAPLF